MSKNISQEANSDIIAKSLQMKYNEVLRSFFTPQSDFNPSISQINIGSERLDLERLLKSYYACPPQN